MTTEIDTIPLFDLPEREVLRAAKTIAQSEKDRNPSWTSYSGKRLACDECILFLHENGGRGPHPRSVRSVRTVRSTGEQLRLCKEHAEPRKQADKDAAEKRKKATSARRPTSKGA
jgi:hypothetical protein